MLSSSCSPAFETGLGEEPAVEGSHAYPPRVREDSSGHSEAVDGAGVIDNADISEHASSWTVEPFQSFNQMDETCKLRTPEGLQNYRGIFKEQIISLDYKSSKRHKSIRSRTYLSSRVIL